MEDPFPERSEPGRLAFADRVQPARQNGRKAGAVGDVVEGGEGMLDEVHGEPHLSQSCRRHAIQGKGCRPHQSGPGLIVGGIMQHLQGTLDGVCRQPFHQPVLDRSLGRRGTVEFQDVAQGIDGAVGGIFRRDAAGGLGGEYRDLWEEMPVGISEFLLRGLVGDNHARVHLRTGGGKSRDTGDRQ